MKTDEMIQGMREHLRVGDHVSIEISHPGGDALVASLKEKMEDASSSVSISRVPEKLTRQKMMCYVPENVSIGPFHRGRSSLQRMEEHKWRYLFAILNRNAEELESSLEKCVKALRELEHRTRRCYSEPIPLSSNDFVEMLLLDAGFIIELFIKYSNRTLRKPGDTIFSTPGKLFHLRSDIILLENQIPLFILKRIFQIIPLPHHCTQTLPDLAYRFFKNMVPAQTQKEKFSEEAHHLLDMVHNCLLPLTHPRDPQPDNESSSEERRLNCVTELKRSGVRFQSADQLDITFSNGVIRVPKLFVNEATERLLRNLIALEQCQCVQTLCVSTYVHLMSNLLCSDKDEKVLQKRGIIVDSLNGEVKLSVLFRDLCAELELHGFWYYREVCDEVKAYCEKKRGRTTTTTKRRSKLDWELLFGRSGSGCGLGPAMVMSLVVVILLLSFVGTIFSVLSFFLHHG